MCASFPEVNDLGKIVTGDMPGDSVHLTQIHLDKARAVFPEMWDLLTPILAATPQRRAVVSVHGGSGVGKSEIGSLLAHGLNANGLGTYVLSGDNYPRRIPSANDAERLRVYREAGAAALEASGLYDDSVRDALDTLRAAAQDAEPSQAAENPWLTTYLAAGRRALAAYLGTPREVNFDEINAILEKFHSGAACLTLKRMGRTEDQLWYDEVDVSDVQVIVLEWTHGNSDYLRGVDVPILLNSTPEETLAHRRSRQRDGGVDSPFTTMVLGLEQEKLHAQARRAAIIVAKSGEVQDYAGYLDAMDQGVPDARPAVVADSGPMLNFYPDSLGGTLADAAAFMLRQEVKGAFTSAYVLPSVFNTDLDRGFSVIDYGLSERYATRTDLDALAEAGISLKFDFILNHASVLSPQFQDLLARGEDSEFAGFFIDWNAFWAGHGDMTPEGYIQPDAELIKDMFFRKPGLPILMVRMPDGTEVPYWNTFYQEILYAAPDAQDLMAATGMQYGRAALAAERMAAVLASGGRPGDVDPAGFEDVLDVVVEFVDSHRRYLGQMDLNIESPLVWDFYAHTLDTLAGYGAQIVRLDAFAYAPKEPGLRNFLNEPGTWELLAGVKELADARSLELLPEIHSTYATRIHEKISAQGFLTYDFFLPGLVIDAFEQHDASVLKLWIDEVIEKKIRTVTMLGCHDGIPLLDLEGLLSGERIQGLIDVVKSRGGYVKDLHGAKNMYYQVNATYYSALGESDARMLLARAIHIFVPGKPQVWYLDLFAGGNDHDAVEKAGPNGHKEINRTNLSLEAVGAGLNDAVVSRQIELLRFRSTCEAFGFDAQCEVAETDPGTLRITWTRAGASATLDADLVSETFAITATDADGIVTTMGSV